MAWSNLILAGYCACSLYPPSTKWRCHSSRLGSILDGSIYQLYKDSLGELDLTSTVALLQRAETAISCSLSRKPWSKHVSAWWWSSTA